MKPRPNRRISLDAAEIARVRAELRELIGDATATACPTTRRLGALPAPVRKVVTFALRIPALSTPLGVAAGHIASGVLLVTAVVGFIWKPHHQPFVLTDPAPAPDAPRLPVEPQPVSSGQAKNIVPVSNVTVVDAAQPTTRPVRRAPTVVQVPQVARLSLLTDADVTTLLTRVLGPILGEESLPAGAAVEVDLSLLDTEILRLELLPGSRPTR